jgi:hypothetical protein
MQQYQHKSVEELRFEDYTIGNKDGQAQAKLADASPASVIFDTGGPYPHRASFPGLHQAFSFGAVRTPPPTTAPIWFDAQAQSSKTSSLGPSFNFTAPLPRTTISGAGFAMGLADSPPNGGRRTWKVPGRSGAGERLQPALAASIGGVGGTPSTSPHAAWSVTGSSFDRRRERQQVLAQLASLQQQQQQLLRRLQELDDASQQDEWDVSKVGNILSGK